jgi:hypothetical protein
VFLKKQKRRQKKKKRGEKKENKRDPIIVCFKASKQNSAFSGRMYLGGQPKLRLS